MLRRLPVLLYGITCYLIGASAYFVGFGGFLANLLGDYSVDAGVQSSLPMAITINLALILLFGVPHSLMARESFKRIWTRIIPDAMERSTYMLQAGLLAVLLIWQWQAIPVTLWRIDNAILEMMIWGLYWCGWGIAFIATFLINHFELTGLQQVYAHFRGQEPMMPEYRTPFLYKIVRHPMQLGVIIAFWATPHMTLGRFVFAIGMTAYILIGLYFEERDLVRRFGDTYQTYQQTTPMLIPLLKRRHTSTQATHATNIVLDSTTPIIK